MKKLSWRDVHLIEILKYMCESMLLQQNRAEQITSFENWNQDDLAKNSFEGDLTNILLFSLNFQASEA